MSGVEEARGGYGYGGYGCGGFGGFTNTGAILVLFILLVIITKSFLC
ncbi:YjcZ family sporulation protein [Paenibacillus sp. CC-CFT742]|nr:YjcZ family sporulation protein [Paenibacillus sp. CC-CFT742]WJH27882.1 YjcZ family sporulation protein [Paenibacillus sp. CC-CFT742]